MKEKLKAFYDKYKQWVDQTAHVIVGAVLTLLFSMGVPTYVAAPLTFGLAVLREVAWQHLGRCGWGCRLDLVGFTVGITAVSIWLTL